MYEKYFVNYIIINQSNKTKHHETGNVKRYRNNNGGTICYKAKRAERAERVHYAIFYQIW